MRHIYPSVKQNNKLIQCRQGQKNTHEMNGLAAFGQIRHAVSRENGKLSH